MILLELHAGTHGQMAHFISLQNSCRALGLKIPDVESPVFDDPSILWLIAALTSPKGKANVAETAAAAGAAGAAGEKEHIIFDLEKAARRFDFWMKEYTHYDTDTHTQKLVGWLYRDSGARLVDTYENFCFLANRLKDMKYNIPVPPDRDAFEKGVAEYHRRVAEAQKHSVLWTPRI